MEMTVICLLLICAYNYLRISKANKRIGQLESSLDDLAKTAAGTGADEVYV